MHGRVHSPGVNRRLASLAASLALVAGGCGDDDDGAGDGASQPEWKPPAWSYSENGGAEKWASLSERYAACETGMEQSPIDLAHARKAPLPPLKLDYKAGPAEIENNGHTVEVIYELGTNSVTVEGTEYDLVQSHYHLPSEHEIAFVQEPIEMHFVHVSEDREFLVLGAFVRAGETNSAWDPVAADLPGKEGGTHELEQVSPLDLLPEDAATGWRWSYSGSLTTPPCTEGVAWNILRTRIEMSPSQIAEFKDVFEGNRRPVQPRHGRGIVLGRPR